MRLAISNLAWNPLLDESVSKLLIKYGVSAIDVAPGKYFADVPTASSRDVDEVKHRWARNGIEIIGMQALLFGTSGLNLFGPPDASERMLSHLEHVCRVGAGLGATRLVFGSPKNRDCTGLSQREANAIATEFFWRLGGIAERYGVCICLEPVPSRYGSNFMTTTVEAALIVEQVNHPAIRMQLDTGAATANQEDIDEILARYWQLVGHVHASEPGLGPLGDGGTDHGKVRAALTRWLHECFVSIEMLASESRPQIAAIERAILVGIREYL